MSKAYVRLLVLAFLGSGLAPLVTIVASESFTRYQNGEKLSLAYHPVVVVVAAVVIVVALVAYVLSRRLEPNPEQNAEETATFSDTLPLSYVDLAILVSAPLTPLL